MGGSIVSHKACLDKTINPQGIHIGENTFITGRVVILTHYVYRGLKVDTCIGDNCFIGLNSIILPGIVIGNEVVVGAGSVVTKNIPSNCIAAGNPAKIIRTGIRCGKFGKIIGDNKNG